VLLVGWTGAVFAAVEKVQSRQGNNTGRCCRHPIRLMNRTLTLRIRTLGEVSVQSIECSWLQIAVYMRAHVPARW
jgi:hypothetical protein